MIKEKCERWLKLRSVAMDQKLIPDYRIGLELYLTLQDCILIFRTTSVCFWLSANLCTCLVCSCSLVGLYVLSAPWSIHQERHFLPFCIQTLGYMCYLLSVGHKETWLIRLDTKKFYHHNDPLIGLACGFYYVSCDFCQTNTSSIPKAESKEDQQLHRSNCFQPPRNPQCVMIKDVLHVSFLLSFSCLLCISCLSKLATFVYIWDWWNNEKAKLIVLIQLTRS